jgi:hypothetical protein
VVNKEPRETGFGAGGQGVPEWGGKVFNTDVKNGVEKKKVQSLSRAITEGSSGLHSAMCVTPPEREK